MLTRLGKPPAPGDAVDLLLECHRRIRDFLGLAGRLAEAAVELVVQEIRLRRLGLADLAGPAAQAPARR